MKCSFVKIIVLVLLAFILHSSRGFSQEASGHDKKNSLKSGSWSMQFAIESNFRLTSFQGSNLSLKRHLTDKSAIRLGISFDADIKNTEGEGSFEEGNQKDTNFRDEDLYSFRISSLYIIYPVPEKKVNLFFGVGPFYNYSKFSALREDVSTIADTLFTKTVSNTNSDGWGVGFSMIMGLEWFVNKSISLGAEYGTSVSYFRTVLSSRRVTTSNDPSTSRTRAENSETSDYRVSANSVKLGLSVYF